MPRNVCDSTEPCLIAQDIDLILMINWFNIDGNLSQFTILKGEAGQFRPINCLHTCT